MGLVWLRDAHILACVGRQRKCSRKRGGNQSYRTQGAVKCQVGKAPAKRCKNKWCGTYVDRHLLEAGVDYRVRKWLTERWGGQVRIRFCFRTGMGLRIRKWLAKRRVEDGVRKTLKVQETRPRCLCSIEGQKWLPIAMWGIM